MYNDLNINNRVYLIYCDIGNYKRWIKESTNIKVFFNSLDNLKSSLNELKNIKYDYYEPTPDKELNELYKNEQKYIQEFLNRLWLKTISETTDLKTQKGKENKIKMFYDNIEQYKNRFSKETIKLIEDAKKDKLNYSLMKSSKAEKDLLFLKQTENILKSQDKIMYNIENANGNYAWFYNNSHILNFLMKETIDIEIIYDITRLLLVGFTYKKASKYLSLKYKLKRKYAEKIFLVSTRIVYAYRDYKVLKNQYQNDSQFSKQYFINTNSVPCDICQKYRGKVFNIKDAKIGINFPPFCTNGCSTAALYMENITSLPKSLKYDEKLFAKAYNFFENEDYESAAEYGLQAYNLVPDSIRYIKIVPDMLVKANRLKEAVDILENFINKYTADSFIVAKYQKYYEKLQRANKK